MNISAVVRQRLLDLGFVQQDLAAASGVTESYVSQLLQGKKLPPAANRTGIYQKMGKFLGIPASRLVHLAEAQRLEEMKKKLADPLPPLHREVRELILRKCKSERVAPLKDIFASRPFGELERLVTQKLLDVAKSAVQAGLAHLGGLKIFVRPSHRKRQRVRAAMRGFLNTDVFSITPEQCRSFLEPLIESWDIDFGTFAMEIALNRKLAPVGLKRFEFREQEAPGALQEEPGLQQFLRDPALSQHVTEQEMEFLKRLRFAGKRPTALYFYRELQNLRDPILFTDNSSAKHDQHTPRSHRSMAVAPPQRSGGAGRFRKQLDLETRKAAGHRWTGNSSGTLHKTMKKH